MADSQISTGDLRNITTNIKKDTDKINDLYNLHISKALEECQDDLILSGVDFQYIQDSYKNLFTNLISQLNEFTDALSNNIIPRYEATASSITKLFNQDFANEMNEYLNIINKD